MNVYVCVFVLESVRVSVCVCVCVCVCLKYVVKVTEGVREIVERSVREILEYNYISI